MKNLIKILTIFFVVVLLFGIFSNAAFAGSSSATATRSLSGEITFFLNDEPWGNPISLSNDTKFIIKQTGNLVYLGLGSSPSDLIVYENFVYDSNADYSILLFDDLTSNAVVEWFIYSGSVYSQTISGSGFYIVYITSSSNVPSYSISFNSNGGSSIPRLSDQTSIPSNIQTSSMYRPVKLNYTFDGWYLNSSLTTRAIGGSSLSANITLYAKWTPVQSTPSTVDVTYIMYDNPLSPGGAPSQRTETYDYGDSVSVIYDFFDTGLTGYVFDGWYYNSNFTNKVGAVGDTSTLTSDLTVYGRYVYSPSTPPSPSTVNVTFILADIPSGAPYSSSSTYTYYYGDSATVIYDYNPNESGFDGWYYNSNYTNKVGGVGDTTTLTSDLTVYGRFVYVPPTYTISFESNGGSSVYALSGQTTIPSQLPVSTRYGYSFLGWYTDEELQDPVVPGATLSRNITLYAGWQFVPGTDIYVDPGNSLRGMFTGLMESLLTCWLTISSQVGFGGITLLSVSTTVLVVLLIYFVIKVIKG